MTNPSQYGWGPGWPQCQTSKMKTLVRADGFRQPFRQEIIPLLAWLMDETERRGYNIRPDWSWGFDCRQIRGSNAPSLHSWGLAIDINAPVNPMLKGSPGWQWLHDHGRTDMPAWMPPLWKSMGFGWGGDYGTRQDAMHMEVKVSPADVARITASIGKGEAPFQLKRTLHFGDHGEDVKQAQNLLTWVAARYENAAFDPGTPDGVFGAKTQRAVMAFKMAIYALEGSGHHTFNKPFSSTVGGVTYGALQFWASL